MLRSTALSVLLTVLLTAWPARAEILEMRQTIYGMDCSSCSHPLGVALKRLPGVESVEVSLERGQADIHFLPGNTASVGDVLAVIRKDGFVSKETELWVNGTLVESDGRVALTVGRAIYRLGPSERLPELRALVGKIVTLHGQLALEPSKGAPTLLVVGSVSLKETKP